MTTPDTDLSFAYTRPGRSRLESATFLYRHRQQHRLRQDQDCVSAPNPHILRTTGAGQRGCPRARLFADTYGADAAQRVEVATVAERRTPR